MNSYNLGEYIDMESENIYDYFYYSLVFRVVLFLQFWKKYIFSDL